LSVNWNALASVKTVQVNPQVRQNKQLLARKIYQRELRARPQLPAQTELGHTLVRVLKASPNRVAVVRYKDQELVLKRFRRSWVDRFRASRARRAWAAARTLTELGLPSLEPVGFGEDDSFSYFVYRFDARAITVRDWIKPRMHRQPDAFRHQVADEIFGCLLDLYEHGLYHRDAKAGNLLVEPSHDPDIPNRFAWIDLEDLVPAKLNEKRLFKNLIQLNGSICRRIPRADRMRFLDALAERFPEARVSGLAAAVEQETHRRLMREVRRTESH